MKRWAALTPEGEIVSLGFTEKRFQRQCLRFTALGFASWIASGARYTELYVPHFEGIYWREFHKRGTSIRDVPHGRIRRHDERYYRTKW
jgi:hypothetical protein